MFEPSPDDTELPSADRRTFRAGLQTRGAFSVRARHGAVTHAVMFLAGMLSPVLVVVFLIANPLSMATTDQPTPPPQPPAAPAVPRAEFFGSGVRPGAPIVAYIGSTICGTANATSTGQWSITIAENAGCRPVPGVEVNFLVDQVPQRSTPPAIWERWGRPSSVTGYALEPR